MGGGENFVTSSDIRMRNDSMRFLCTGQDVKLSVP